MKRDALSRKLLLCVCAVAVAAFVAGAIGCAPKANPGNPTPKAEKAAVTPEPDQFGVVKADQWKDIYPHQYASYLENADNTPPFAEYQESQDTTSQLPEGWTPVDSGKADYLEVYPEIKTLGKGYGYAKYYTEPAGHVYSLWSVTHNGRIGDLSETKAKAGCIACKTPQFSNEVDRVGIEIWQRPFADEVAKYDENISCASCHANDPTTLEVDRADWVRAMGKDHETASLQGQVCGQCHCDYSMDPVTAQPTSPYYGGLDSMVPEKALQWYDEHEYADWVYASTGAKMLAVRHAEYEFCYGGEGNHMTSLGYDCNDCHMAPKFADDGTAYTDHHWISPLDNQELIDRNCSTCHEDITAEVKAWQEDIDGRTHLVGLRCEKFIKNLESKVATEQDDPANPGQKALILDESFAAKNGIDASTLAKLQKVQRDSCYYWNFIAAENSEGAHNPALYNSVIDTCAKILDEGDKILGMSSIVS